MLKSIFSSYYFISLIAKKSKQEISRVFSAFRRFHQNRKMAISKIGNGEYRNGERGTGEGERGTGNGERGTGNGERGTGNGESLKRGISKTGNL